MTSTNDILADMQAVIDQLKTECGFVQLSNREHAKFFDGCLIEVRDFIPDHMACIIGPQHELLGWMDFKEGKGYILTNEALTNSAHQRLSLIRSPARVKP